MKNSLNFILFSTFF